MPLLDPAKVLSVPMHGMQGLHSLESVKIQHQILIQLNVNYNKYRVPRNFNINCILISIKVYENDKDFESVDLNIFSVLIYAIKK
jgi:hypothetical protein